MGSLLSQTVSLGPIVDEQRRVQTASRKTLISSTRRRLSKLAGFIQNEIDIELANAKYAWRKTTQDQEKLERLKTLLNSDDTVPVPPLK